MTTPRRSRSLLESFNFAFEGIIHALRTQRNLRLHFLIAVAVIVAAVAFDVTRIELIALLLSITFVLIAEMLNSAIEAAVDMASTSFDPLAKLAKDVAAGAVLIASINAVAVGYLVFSGDVAERSGRFLDRLSRAPADLTVVALVLVVILVIVGKALSGRGAPLRGGLPSGHAAVAFSGWMVATLVLRRLESPLPDLQPDVHHGLARGPDPRGGRCPHDARGERGRAARLARHARSLPALLPGMSDAELLACADTVAVRAYAPYSRYHVGCAVLARDGRVIEGVNVENAAYPLGVCAERTAFARAIVEGYRPGDFVVAAITASPCGGCRQWLVEMGVERVVFRHGDGVRTMTPAELLPDTFEL